jgi:hypothetical protein
MFDAEVDEGLVDDCCPLDFGHLDGKAVVGGELYVVSHGELADHHVLLGHEPDELLPSGVGGQVRREEEEKGGYLERSLTTAPLTLMIPPVFAALPVTRLMMVVLLRTEES